jgi:hypothetical protein
VAQTCPWCNAPRDPGPSCPKCGANYAKAEAIKQQGRAAPVAAAVEPGNTELARKLADFTVEEDPERVEDPLLEFKFCLAAIPAMLFIAVLFNITGMGHSLQRMFLAMPVHELGHAVTAWLCGFFAIPSLWVTRTAEDQSIFVSVALVGCVGYMMYRGWMAEKMGLVAAGAVILVLHAIGALVLEYHTTRALITFGGYGTGMILSVLLMASFFFGKDTNLYKGSLRWGFVAIGAAAFVDQFGVWVRSWRDHNDIPFGMQEGAGKSDPLKLVEDYNWTIETLVGRYMALGVSCLLVLAAVYAWGVWQAWKRVEADRKR